MAAIFCQACGATFPNEAALRDHGARAHPMAPGTAPQPAFVCKACGSRLNSEIELKEHGAKAHPM